MNIHKLIILGLVFFVCTGIRAQDEDVTKCPGYVNLEDIEIPESAENVTDITLGPALLKLVKQISDDKDKEVSKNINGFISIRVKSFDIDTKVATKIRPMIDRIEKRLKNQRWESLVRVKEGDKITNISVKYDNNEKMNGLMIMSLDPRSEASFVNIVGKIDLNQLGNFGVKLDGSALDSLKKSAKK